MINRNTSKNQQFELRNQISSNGAYRLVDIMLETYFPVYFSAVMSKLDELLDYLDKDGFKG